jgi:phenylpyruvate tautomerase PptA (4-oxalocrotonate tautomerase family)
MSTVCETDLFLDRIMEKEFRMPLIQLDTSFSIPDQSRKQAIARMLSQIAAQGTGKPEQYVMAGVHDNVAMTMSGASGPCALITVKAVGGLSKSVNQAIAGKVSQLLQKELSISQDRIYVIFEELAPTHWAWEGKTFG